MKEGWEIKKLGDVCIISAGQGAPQGESNYCTNGIPFIKAGNLEGLINGLPESTIQNVSDEVAKKHRLKLYKAGSVVFAKSGMSCMKGYVYALKNDCYVVSHLAILTPHSIDTFFLKYLLEFYRPNTLVKDSAYPSISLEDIKSFSVPVPSLSEQEKIVAELDCLSGIIEKKKQQLKEYDALAQSIFYEMFGDPVENEKGWEMKKMGDISTIGTGATPSRFKEDLYYGGGIPWVKTTEVQNCDITKTEETITKLAIEETNCKLYPSGTLLMAMYGQGKTRGQIAKLKISATTNQACAAIMLNETICNLEYIYELLFINYDNIRAMAQGGNQANLNLKLVSSIPIILPPLSLQQAFATKIEAIEKQKELIKKSIEEVETLFNSRMEYYFN